MYPQISESSSHLSFSYAQHMGMQGRGMKLQGAMFNSLGSGRPLLSSPTNLGFNAHNVRDARDKAVTVSVASTPEILTDPCAPATNEHEGVNSVG